MLQCCHTLVAPSSFPISFLVIVQVVVFKYARDTQACADAPGVFSGVSCGGSELRARAAKKRKAEAGVVSVNEISCSTTAQRMTHLRLGGKLRGVCAVKRCSQQMSHTKMKAQRVRTKLQKF